MCLSLPPPSLPHHTHVVTFVLIEKQPKENARSDWLKVLFLLNN